MPTNNSSATIQALGSITFAATPDITTTPTAKSPIVDTFKKPAYDQLMSMNPSGSLNADVIMKAFKNIPAPMKTESIVLFAEKNYPPMPECIMENDKKGEHYTTVKWTDGTYTTVKLSKDDADDKSAYMAFCCALAKKIYGTNSKIHRIVDRHNAVYLGNKKAAEEAEKRRKQKEHEAKIERAKILAEAKRLRIKEAAKEYNRNAENKACHCSCHK